MDDFSIKITMLPAKSGDCFLVEFDNDQIILIDSGYVETYDKHLKNKLTTLASQNKNIDLFIVTHIDNDHISGAIKLIRENGVAQNKIISIDDIWFNTFNHLVFKKDKVCKVNEKQKEEMQQIIAENITAHNNTEDGLDLISTKSSISFEKALMENGYKINNAFSGEPIIYSDNVVQIGDLSIRILAPTSQTLTLLSDFWENELHAFFGKKYEICSEEDSINFYHSIMSHINSNEISVEAVSASDTANIKLWDNEIKNEKITPPNKASISIIIEYKGKTMLFLADTEVDYHIIQTIKTLYGEQHVFDAIKLSHHGSYTANIALIGEVIAKNYLVSSDGKKFNHPNKALISKILNEKHSKNVYFNYNQSDFAVLNNKNEKQKYNYEVFWEQIVII